jgi:hypothetical protein
MVEIGAHATTTVHLAPDNLYIVCASQPVCQNLTGDIFQFEYKKYLFNL